MGEVDLSPSLIRFIHASLPSYEAAVLLVFVSREPERVWTVEDLHGAMAPQSVSRQDLHGHVGHLVRAGILSPVEGGGFQLQACTDEVRAVLEDLRAAYDQRPVTLIRVIDSAARAKIQAFADSFKLKRD